MKANIEVGMKIFIKMLADLFILNFGKKNILFDYDQETQSVRFANGLYSLCRVYLGEKKQLHIFKNLERMDHDFMQKLINLCSFLKIEIKKT